MSEKKTSALYRFIKALVRLCYPKTAVVGTEHLSTDEPCIVVGNHAQMHGPIACELYFPGRRYIWCAGEMMHLREVPAYAYNDFWSKKPRWQRPFFKLCAYLIAPLSVCVFNNADTVPVYHDARLMTTFKDALAKLQQGASMVIFPEHDVPGNHILCQFQDKFVDIARLYYKKTGKELSFVPLYLAPSLRSMYLGAPIRFSAAAPIAEERQRICAYLHDTITDMACTLPQHTVVPYQNCPKKDYPTNRVDAQ